MFERIFKWFKKANRLTPEGLIESYGYWGQHPEFPVSDWEYEVANDNTRRGYWQWVHAKIGEADG